MRLRLEILPSPKRDSIRSVPLKLDTSLDVMQDSGIASSTLAFNFVDEQ
jgi:hypothetical protein